MSAPQKVHRKVPKRRTASFSPLITGVIVAGALLVTGAALIVVMSPGSGSGQGDVDTLRSKESTNPLCGQWESENIRLILYNDESFDLTIALVQVASVTGLSETAGKRVRLRACHRDKDSKVIIGGNGTLEMHVDEDCLVLKSWDVSDARSRNAFAIALSEAKLSLFGEKKWLEEPPIRFHKVAALDRQQSNYALYVRQEAAAKAQKKFESEMQLSSEFFNRVVDSIRVTDDFTTKSHQATLVDGFGRMKELEFPLLRPEISETQRAGRLSAQALQAGPQVLKQWEEESLRAIPSVVGRAHLYLGFRLGEEDAFQLALIEKFIEWAEAARTNGVTEIEREFVDFARERELLSDYGKARKVKERFFFTLNRGLCQAVVRREIPEEDKKLVSLGVTPGLLRDETEQRVTFGDAAFWFYAIKNKDVLTQKATASLTLEANRMRGLEEQKKADQAKELRGQQESAAQKEMIQRQKEDRLKNIFK